MDPERLPIQVPFGRIEGKRPIGRARETWIETVRDTPRVLSDLNNKSGTLFIMANTDSVEGAHSQFGRYKHHIFRMETCNSSSAPKPTPPHGWGMLLLLLSVVVVVVVVVVSSIAMFRQGER